MIARSVRFVVSCVMLIAALLAVGSPASSRQSGPDLVPGQPVYLALGDSIANGQQSADVVPGDYWATVAGWQANGYVAQFGKYLKKNLDCVPGRGPATGPGCRQLQVLNLARSAVPSEVQPPGKPGVTTQAVIDEQLPVAVPLVQARNNDKNPRNDVRVVTLTVGGNDIFGPIIAACVDADPPSPDGCSTAIKTAFYGFAVNYENILAQLREAAGDGADLFTMTYYNPLPYCALGAANPAAGPFGDYVLEHVVTMPGVAPGFNGLIETISAKYHAKVADTFGVLGTGDFVGGADCLHPDQDGHAKIATVFEEAFDN